MSCLLVIIPQDVIFNIYKYTEYKWAKRLIDYGEIRLSPINKFHDTIKHGEALGDVNEGTFTKTIEQLTAKEYKAAIKQGGTKMTNKIASLFSGLEGKGHWHGTAHMQDPAEITLQTF